MQQWFNCFQYERKVKRRDYYFGKTNRSDLILILRLIFLLNLGIQPAAAISWGVGYYNSDLMYNPFRRDLIVSGNCYLCPKGYYCPDGSANYYLCPPGQYAPYEGMGSWCIWPVGQEPDASRAGWIYCTAGTYKSLGMDYCAACPAGQTSSPGESSCTGANYCGDNKVEDSEMCDDGNTASGDGCSNTCNVELGWEWVGGSVTSPSSCSIKCGDSIRLSVESCDDGNTANFDGWSSSCSTESGWTCVGAVNSVSTWSPTCGDSQKKGAETCDDGNNAGGDGCSPSCMVEPGYICTGIGPNSWVLDCGDGRQYSDEAWDDGNIISNDGCSNLCQIESGYTWSGGSTSSGSTCSPTWGDSIKIGAETCDDGNSSGGDGCSSSCIVESGYICTGGGSGSWVLDWGDGRQYPGEAWDDGNPNSGDGWSNSCYIESGFTCNGGSTTTSSICTPTWGDSQKKGAETCDDGNNTGGDGCSSSCMVEPGYICTGAGSGSWVLDCGDGNKYPGEAWDDGNTINNDGWSNNCIVEVGWSWNGGSTSTASICAPIWGDGRQMQGEGCDDSNTANNDGCSSVCLAESGYTCTGGTPSTPSTCLPVWGDGLRIGTESWDDGNKMDNQGCKSDCSGEINGWHCTLNAANKDIWAEQCGDGYITISEGCEDANNNSLDGCFNCQPEPGWTCTSSDGQSSTCISVWGDSRVVGTEAWDDGNTANLDGCTNSCTVETGWQCPGGTPSTASTCNPVCGDSRKVASREPCEDGNTNSGDGWSSTCTVEPGWTCSGGSISSIDTCNVICGDGLRFPSEQWDDGNAIGFDGCSSLCRVEEGYSCSGGSPTSKDIWGEMWGDGKVIVDTLSNCDDGNLIDGDGCDSNCAVEVGWNCFGGSPFSPDSCETVWGDGKLISSREACDDGNKLSGDGCSFACQVESGYTCKHDFTQVIHSKCGEIWGDGKNNGGVQWDDGNLVENDGCSSNWEIETGFTCSRGTPTHRDIWVEICGDGKDFGFLECEDGNSVSGDGWSNTCELEHCYECKEGTPTIFDIWKELHITATMQNLTSDFVVAFNFSYPMRMTSFTPSDIFVKIASLNIVKFQWYAQYTNPNSLQLTLDVTSVLEGDETLEIRFIDLKKFRGQSGGWVTTTAFKSPVFSTLSGSTDAVSATSGFAAYTAYGGIVVSIGLVIIGGGSMEMIWALINTLQLISYLPLMTPYFPAHVRMMFQILSFANWDFEILSDTFKKLIMIDGLDVEAFSDKFAKNGIESPLFLENWASLLLSLLMSWGTFLSFVMLYYVLWWDKMKSFVNSLISSFFFNNFLRFFTEGYLEVSFGVFLNIASHNRNKTEEVISLVSSAVVCILCVIFPFLTAAFLYDKRGAIIEGNSTYLKRFGTMYSNQRTDRRWYHFQYYSVFLIRRLVFVVFLIFASDYPEAQWNCFIMFTLLTCAYLILVQPFQNKVDNVLFIINECSLLVISLLQIIFITDFRQPSVIENTGWVMISVCTINIMVNFGICIVTNVKARVDKWRKKKISPEKPNLDIMVTENDTTHNLRSYPSSSTITMSATPTHQTQRKSTFRRANESVRKRTPVDFSRVIRERR